VAAKNVSIEAIVSGLRDGGCSYATNYPGTYSQDIFFGLGGTRISANERVAFEMAYGASLAGKRSVVTMKNVGVNACADPFLHAALSGVQGGFVIVVTDDTKVTGSQEREDSRHYIDFFGGLWLEPSTVQMGYDMAQDAFRLSEELDVPVVIRLTSQYFEQVGSFTTKPPIKADKPIAKDPAKFIVYPNYWQQQWDNLKRKQRQIEAHVAEHYAAAELPKGRGEGVLVLGACDQELSSPEYRGCDTIHVNMYPLPMEYIARFSAGRKRLHILEQGDAWAAEKITLHLAKPTLPLDIESETGFVLESPSRWITWDHLEKLFNGLKAIDPTFVVADVGQYTVESTGVVNSCLCLGSSVGTATGLEQAGVAYPFCVVGDGSFLHSSSVALSEAHARGAKFGVIIIDNGGSAATGGQELIVDARSVIDDDIDCYELEYKDNTEVDFAGKLEQMRKDNKLAVLIVKFKPEQG
jgi:indolepyruvate ferredoxin oxidoreductase, alpha subunit